MPLRAIRLASVLPLDAFLLLRPSPFAVSDVSLAISKCPFGPHARQLDDRIKVSTLDCRLHQLSESVCTNGPALTCLRDTWHFNILIMINGIRREITPEGHEITVVRNYVRYSA